MPLAPSLSLSLPQGRMGTPPETCKLPLQEAKIWPQQIPFLYCRIWRVKTGTHSSLCYCGRLVLGAWQRMIGGWAVDTEEGYWVSIVSSLGGFLQGFRLSQSSGRQQCSPWLITTLPFAFLLNQKGWFAFKRQTEAFENTVEAQVKSSRLCCETASSTFSQWPFCLQYMTTHQTQGKMGYISNKNAHNRSQSGLIRTKSQRILWIPITAKMETYCATYFMIRRKNPVPFVAFHLHITQ